MLGLALSLPRGYDSIFLSFKEKDTCRAFLNKVRENGFETGILYEDKPHFRRALSELCNQLKTLRASILCCHGYKADLLGLAAARCLGIPVVAVSRGWTAATARVRFNEILDRISLHFMDRVVCVSEGQARKVRRAGVPNDRITVIHNAIDVSRFGNPNPSYRDKLHQLFEKLPARVVGAAGRLSPEKGFEVLVKAAAVVVKKDPSIGFVLFGDGPLRGALERQISQLGLEQQFILAGFSSELDRYYPSFDLVVLPSHTEGLPNAALEAFAAGVPVVATAVGGTPEVIEEGESGFLVPPANPTLMANRILDVLVSETKRLAMGGSGRNRVQTHFSFEGQSAQYQRLFESLVMKRSKASASWRLAANGHVHEDYLPDRLAPASSR
jgi:glycosyltransferase involved in cell wall biosynthesis